MEGVETIVNNDYSVFYIVDFSKEFKNAIRKNLSSICHGAADVATGHELYSYKNTLTEFLKRYKTKTDKQKKGMIGELLLHILMTELQKNFIVNSPYFNTEERNVKKGFDLVITRAGTTELWIAEVKSGQLDKGKNSSQTMVQLIDTAQNDLIKRLNEDSVSLWLNAINGAKCAIDERRNEKEAIISLLQDCGDKATQNSFNSKKVNVILAGTLYNSLSDRISEQSVVKKHKRVISSNCFNGVYLICIQKETYLSVIDFLESESKS